MLGLLFWRSLPPCADPDPARELLSVVRGVKWLLTSTETCERANDILRLFSASILSCQMLLLVDNSAKVNFISGKMTVTPSNRGRAKMFMKPSCDSASLRKSFGSGGPPNKQVGRLSSFSMAPWLANSSVRTRAHCAAHAYFRA